MDSNNELITLRTMRDTDLPDCHHLRELIGWNQTERDWKRFLSYNPEGCFVASGPNWVAGTACTIPYEDKFGWVSMVIVNPKYRRMGIGTQLLNAGIKHLENRGLTVKLDATPEGKKLYDTLGFQDEYQAARMECSRPIPLSHTPDCRSLCLPKLDELNEYDRSVFGASRKPVLLSYLRQFPQYSFFIRTSNQITGFIMAREGTHAFHIGPWVARDEETARHLLFSVLEKRRPERVFIDILEPNPHARRMLESLGFKQQRPFTRMFKGENNHPGFPEQVYGISGPELG